MIEQLNQEELPDRKLEGEELARLANQLSFQARINHRGLPLENTEVRFKPEGTGFVNYKVDGDQQTTHIDVGSREYVDIMTARGPLGVFSVRYVKHGLQLTDLKDSMGAVREVRKVLAKIFPK